jgi:hypothetical protein
MKRYTLLALICLIPFFGSAQLTPFKRVQPCAFAIELPVDMKIKKMYEDSSPDYCDYEVTLRDGYTIMELHSLNKSRFEQSSIKGLYNQALRSSDLNITYNTLGSNFFIISGINPQNGNIVYWKRVLGQNFVSDLHIEYNQGRKAAIEKHIGRIAKSFTSK